MKLKVDRLGINGEGIAKSVDNINENKVCFVPYALPDEVIEADIVADKKSYCNCRLNSIAQRSDDRVEARCKYFMKCGGCDIQHMNKKLQMEFKTKKVKDTIRKISKLDIGVSDTVRLNDFAYRNKMVFPVGDDGKNAVIGMFSSGTHNIIQIDKCLIASDLINEILYLSQQYFQDSKFRGYNFKLKKGVLKYLVVRVSDNAALVTIVATRKVELNEYYNVLMDKFRNIGLSIIISDSDDDILSGKYYPLYGIKELNLEEFGIKYSVDNRGFLQVNNDIKYELYSMILDRINPKDIVIDAYSGAGLLSAIVSKKCKFVSAIEINECASLSARKLAISNGIENINFICGDVKDNLSNILDCGNQQIVILDPPRSGCDSCVLNILLNNCNVVKEIIYVSCNPATLARDLGILGNKFEILSVQPFDMFPQTKHVETLVVLQRKA